MDPSARHLVFHGAIVLLLGLLYGAPYGSAINRGVPPPVVQAWRLAHASVPMGAILMLAVAAVLSSLRVEAGVKWFITVSFTVSGYAFCVSLPLAAIVGHRGLSAGGPASARIVFAGNALGAAASLAGTVALVYAGFVSL